MEHIAANDIRSRYDAYFSDLLQLTDTTEKKAAAMAMISTAGYFAEECFYHDEWPLTLDAVKPFLRSKSEVDQSERAFEYIKGFIAANENRFCNDTVSLEVWGKIDDCTCLINKNILQAKLNEAGFDFDAIKSKWEKAGHLIKNTKEKYIHHTTVSKVKAAYVKLNLADASEQIGSIPF